MKRSGSKLKYQVNQALKTIDQIGVSKYSLERQKLDTGIHSIKQMKETLSTAQNFVAWLKSEKGLMDLYQVKRSHYRLYIDHMKTKEVSNGHLINIETNLRLLNKGMAKVSKDKGMAPRDWCPKKRLIDVRSREKAVNRSLTDQEYEEAYQGLSNHVKVAADLQMAFGLRLREAANTTYAHITLEDGQYYWEAVSDRYAANTAVGVTKAGRGRKALCRPDMEERIQALVKDGNQKDYIVKVKYDTIRSGYVRAGIKGSHSLRHTYARFMLQEEFQQLGIEKQGPDIVQRMVLNRSEGYRKDYQIEQSERLIYQRVKQAIDQVHSYLGHGVSRSDLMDVYLSF
ncbi:integrase [Piscibacillus sp. B03]|uniref:integrase n=1 Tax=Piscibacillus sp. B03 TaxID=3457430 RepID=UPI003FCD5E5C